MSIPQERRHSARSGHHRRAVSSLDAAFDPAPLPAAHSAPQQRMGELRAAAASHDAQLPSHAAFKALSLQQQLDGHAGGADAPAPRAHEM